jgi:hypothetical protein
MKQKGMNNDIVADCLRAMNELEKAFLMVDPAKINTIPFEGSWTAAQVADHILKSVEGLGEMVARGRTVPTDRDPAQQVQGIRDMFLDFETKMKSPDFVLPTEEPLDQTSLLKRMEQVRARLALDIIKLDLTLSCTDFALPGSGIMTRLEWMNFFEVHATRHTRQMQKVAKALK